MSRRRRGRAVLAAAGFGLAAGDARTRVPPGKQTTPRRFKDLVPDVQISDR